MKNTPVNSGAIGVGVGVKSAAVGEIVPTGNVAVCVGKGVSGGAGVSTSTVNEQPETNKLMIRRNANIFFMVEPFRDYRINFHTFDLWINRSKLNERDQRSIGI